jgi:hypothetical protein
MKNTRTINRVQPSDQFGQTQTDQFNYGAPSIIDMSTQIGDYHTGNTGLPNVPQWFKVIPETAGVIKVVLFGCDDETDVIFTITAAQVTAYTGKALPFNIKKVLKTGSTATFSVVW